MNCLFGGCAGSILHRLFAVIIVSALMLGVAESGWSQQSSGGAIEAHLLRTGPSDPRIDAYAEVVGDTITVVLERRGVVVRPQHTDETLLRYEYQLVGFLPRLHVCITVFDAGAGTRIAGNLATARGNVTLYSAVDDLVSGLDPVVAAYLQRRSHPDGGVLPVAVAGQVVFPGEISEDADVRYEEIPSGTVLSPEYTAAQGVYLPVRVSRRGFYSEEIVVPIIGDHVELPTVPLRKIRRFGADVHYGYPRTLGAGVGARYYPVHDRVFAAFELAVAMTGFYGVTPQRMVHTDPRLLFGYAPFGNTRLAVQPVVSTGIGLVSTFVSYTDEVAPRYVDWYWNVVNVAVEVGRGVIRPYLRGGISYYVRTEQGLWDTGLNPDRLSPEIVGGTVVRW